MESSAQVKRILGVFGRARPEELSEGLAWYETANTFAEGLATKHDISIEAASGIIAALSPQVLWERNMTLAESLCAGKRKLPALGANVNKAKRILRGDDPLDVLGGNKVRAFYACIVYPETTDAVCIDRHAYALAEGLVRPNSDRVADRLESVRVYNATSDFYRLAARLIGEVRPCQVQAVTWVVWRNLKRELNAV